MYNCQLPEKKQPNKHRRNPHIKQSYMITCPSLAPLLNNQTPQKSNNTQNNKTEQQNNQQDKNTEYIEDQNYEMYHHKHAVETWKQISKEGVDALHVNYTLTPKTPPKPWTLVE